MVVFIDPFGNVRIAGGREDLERIAGPLATGRPLRVRLKGAKRPLDLTWAGTFGDVPPGTAIAYDDAETAGLAIAVNQGSAAEIVRARARRRRPDRTGLTGDLLLND